MAFPRARLTAPRRLMVSFLVLLLLPAAAVIWLGVELLRQDKDIELRQRRERLASASDRVVASLEQALSAAERRLDSPQAGANDDAIVVRLLPTGLEAAAPGQLLYYPAIPVLSAEPASPFTAGEALEYQSADFAKAAEVFHALARSPTDEIRAGALLRLARNLKKLDRPEAAMDAYDQLAALDRTTVAGLPGDLIARRARCLLLQELGRHEALEREARALRDDLLGMRWKIDRGALTTYLQQIHAWTGLDVTLPPEREAPAELVEHLWEQFAAGRLPGSGRIASRHAGVPLAAVWQSTRDEAVALVAGPRFVQREWLGPAAAAAPGIDLALLPPEAEARQTPGAFAIHRRPGETGLPWTIILTDQRVSDDSGVVSPRRRLLLAGLSLLVLVVGGGGYVLVRAVGREFAVAQLQSDFVSAVSHEFRTPLTSLQQFTSLLAEADGPSPEKRRTFYRAQSRGIERLSRLVESLLDFGRMEAGARTYHCEPHELASLVRDVVGEFREHVAGGDFSIDCRVPDEPIPVRADADALARALWNLLDNAVKYSGTGRVIDVACEIETGRRSARVSVRDHGLGVAAHERRDIFDKFVRGESSRVQGIKGTGIGLAMVRHIVAAHGGRVEVSDAPGGGSTFTIVLPVEED